MVSFQWTAAKFFWFFFITFFSFLYFTYYGMMTVSITPNHQVASVFAAAFYALFNLFSGFFIPRPVSSPILDFYKLISSACTKLNIYSMFSRTYVRTPCCLLQRIPKWWIWYYWLCPVAWTVYGLIVSQYGDLMQPIQGTGMSPDPTIREYIKSHFGYDPDFMAPVAVVLVGFTVFFAFMYAYCIKTLNFQMR